MPEIKKSAFGVKNKSILKYTCLKTIVSQRLQGGKIIIK